MFNTIIATNILKLTIPILKLKRSNNRRYGSHTLEINLPKDES